MDAAEYLISLKDQMSGPASAADGALRKLETSIRQGTAASSALDAKVVSQGAALDGLGSKLQQASDAWRTLAMESDKSKEAEAAVRAQAQVVLALEKQVNQAAQAYEKMQAAASAKSGQVGALKEALPEYQKLSEAAKASGDAQAQHAARFKEFGDAAKGAKGGTDEAGQGIEQLNSKMPQLDGNLGKVQQAIAKLGPVGMVVAAAIGILVTVITAAAATLWAWGSAAVAAAQKKDALLATFNALGAGANAGKETLAMTTRIAASLPFVTSKVNEWAKSLMAAGVQGKALESGIKAVAAATAIMGESGGAAAEGLIKRFAEMAETGQKVKLDRRILNSMAEAGVSAQALADALGVNVSKLGSMSVSADKMGEALDKALIAKGGPALAALGLTWDSIKAKFDEGLGSIFAGMGDAVRPLMEAVKSLFGEFNKGGTTTTLAGGVMKSMLTSLFAVATTVVHGIHIGFLQVEIAMLKVYIFLAPMINAFRTLMGNTTFLSGLSTILKIIGIAILAIVVPLAIITAVFWAVGAAVWAVVGMIVGALTWAVGDATRAAGDLVSGLIGGIMAGGSAVAAAMSNLARGALAAFTGFFTIKSPSRLMMKMGGYIAQGTAAGIDDGAGDVADSAVNMGKGVVSGAASAKGSAKGSGSRGNTYTINHYGPKQDYPSFKEMCDRYFEEEANADEVPA